MKAKMKTDETHEEIIRYLFIYIIYLVITTVIVFGIWYYIFCLTLARVYAILYVDLFICSLQNITRMRSLHIEWTAL